MPWCGKRNSLLLNIKRLTGFYFKELLSLCLENRRGAREAISDTLQPYKSRSPRNLWGFYLILRTSGVSILKVEKDFVGHGARLTKLSIAFQIPYIETSAKDPPLNVDKAFHDLVRVIR